MLGVKGPEMERDEARASQLGRELAALRKRGTLRCAMCGREFEATLRRRFCSDYCRVRANRLAKRAARQAKSESAPGE